MEKKYCDFCAVKLGKDYHSCPQAREFRLSKVSTTGEIWTCWQIDNSNWVRGTYLGYKFEAKIFVEPSDYGIRNGHVSKLTIYKGRKTYIHYDRGWDVGEETLTNWLPVIYRLEKFAQLDSFKKQFSAVV